MKRARFFLLLLAAYVGAAAASGAKDPDLRFVPVPLPGGESGVGFDDLGFAAGARKVLVPGGGTGRLYLVDPESRAVTDALGFGAGKYAGGHGLGTTSADEGAGFIFAIDRTAGKVDVVDPATAKITASVPLGGGPDYVRHAAATGEVWVTEPEVERIEVFRFVGGARPSLIHAAFIEVPGGPESLVVDGARGRAYTHLWKGSTVAVDLKTRAVSAPWPNGCAGSRGIALDEKRGFLFAGCAEGKAAVLDLDHGGRVLGELGSGAGVDIIAYNAKLSHLYVPGAKSATLSVMAVSPTGILSLLGTGETARGAHCAAADDRGQIWVCDPERGRLLMFHDPY